MNNRLSNQLKNEILRIKARKDISGISKIIKDKNLNTVCTSSRCPNLNLCFSNQTATFLLLGDRCTRSCPFCNIESYGVGDDFFKDELEPLRVANAVKELDLKHAVITMVTRDDLEDGGAFIVAETVRAIKTRTACQTVEVLTSDFKGDEKSISIVEESGVDIFGHNIETVKRLYDGVRPGASYKRSLELLKFVAKKNPRITVKSGFMVGLGESDAEVFQAIDDIKAAGADFITIGQYLRPALKNLPVQRYVSMEKFTEYRNYARNTGVKHVYSAPLVRSSFGAEKFFKHSAV